MPRASAGRAGRAGFGGIQVANLARTATPASWKQPRGVAAVEAVT
jgi:hypothetical protein